ncbi:MAG TPA: nuclear transport factor 2 family protein [Chthoniobacterales bacterium]
MVALLTTIAVSIAAPDNDAMMEKEKSAWQAFKDKDEAAFQKAVDHDMVGVYADGIADMAKEMSDMKKWDMKSFKISDFKSHSDEKDVVVTSYVVTLEGTFDGKDASGTYNAGSVWKMEKGKWLAIFHTNTLQAGESSAAQKKE